MRWKVLSRPGLDIPARVTERCARFNRDVQRRNADNPLRRPVHCGLDDSLEIAFAPAAPEAVRTRTGRGLGGARGGGRMISAVRAAPKSGFLGVRLGSRLWRHSCAQALLHSYYHQSVTLFCPNRKGRTRHRPRHPRRLPAAGNPPHRRLHPPECLMLPLGVGDSDALAGNPG